MSSKELYTHMRVKREFIPLLQAMKRKTERSATWHLNKAIEKYTQGEANAKKESK